MHTTRIRLAWLLSATTATMATTALAQGMTPQAAVVEDAWRQCAATTDNTARLACFDAWAQHQQPLTPPPAAAWQAPAASATSANPEAVVQQAAQAPMVQADVVAGQGLVPTNGGCRDPRYSEISRFFELENGTDCGTFTFRGYKPLSVSVVAADSVNQQPSSPGKAPADFRTTASKSCAYSSPPHQAGVGPADQPHFGPARLAVGGLHPAVVLAGVQPRSVTAFPHHRPRARGLLRLPHAGRAALGLAAGATAVQAWCTTPTAKAIRSRAAGTAGM